VVPQTGAGSEIVRPAHAGLTEGAPREAAVPPPGVRSRWLIAASVVVAAFAVAAVVAAWDIRAWLGDVWDSLTSISLAYLAAALFLKTLQTGFSAAAWYGSSRTPTRRRRSGTSQLLHATPSAPHSAVSPRLTPGRS
jgi:hypothetical protein